MDGVFGKSLIRKIKNRLKPHIKSLLKPHRRRAKGSANKERQLLLLFPGRSALWPGVGRELYKVEPVFAETVQRCSRLLEDHFPLIDYFESRPTFSGHLLA